MLGNLRLALFFSVWGATPPLSQSGLVPDPWLWLLKHEPWPGSKVTGTRLSAMRARERACIPNPGWCLCACLAVCVSYGVDHGQETPVTQRWRAALSLRPVIPNLLNSSLLLSTHAHRVTVNTIAMMDPSHFVGEDPIKTASTSKSLSRGSHSLITPQCPRTDATEDSHTHTHTHVCTLTHTCTHTHAYIHTHTHSTLPQKTECYV